MAGSNAAEHPLGVQHYRELCAASIRALGHQPEAYFQADLLFRNKEQISTPALHTPIHEGSVSSVQRRALADAYAMRFTAHDTEVHTHCRPTDDIERLLFNMLEQLRIESVATYPGMRRNLQQHFAEWIDHSQTSGFSDSHAGILVFTLAVACWTRLNNLDVPLEIDGMIEATRHAIGVEVGAALQKLPRYKHEQARYAGLARIIARGVANMLRGERDSSQAQANQQTRSTLHNLGLVVSDSDAQGGEQMRADDSMAQSRVTVNEANQYRVYSSEYDEEADAADLVRAEKIAQHREHLDELVKQSGINAARCAHVFRQLLADQHLGCWNTSEEFGYLDPSRLGSLIAHPRDYRVFRQEGLRRAPDCHVTLLIDCSGSMKQHAAPLALVCDQLNRILGQAAIGTEVLGFTTRSWNGGRPHKQWRTDGKPAMPGRLNECRHIVFKSAAQQWRRARPGIATLLHTESYKEGLDGEALAWAAERLNTKSAQKKIILLVSDGSPMDTSTHLANGDDYLDRHLQSVIRSIDARADISVCALGLGVDLSNRFRHHYCLDLSRDIQNSTLLEIAELLSTACRGQRASFP